MPRVFVVLPVHNRRRITEKFVDCLLKQTFQDYHLILVDDGSSDRTAEAVLDKLDAVSVIRGRGSWWWSGCMQQAFGWLASNGCLDDDLVLLCNDDIAFDRDFISLAVNKLAGLSDTLLGAKVRDPKNDKVVESGIHADFRRFVFRIAESPEQINCLPTRALFLRWKDMKRIGQFHPKLLPHYFADLEYTLRATRLGLRCFTTSEVVITADFSTTGYHNLDDMVGWRFVRHLFSVKSPLNPLYRTAFVALAAPGFWKLVHVVNIWARASTRIVWQGFFHLQFPRQTVRSIRS